MNPLWPCRYGTAVAWSMAVGCLEPGGCSSEVGTGLLLSWPGARCDRAFSCVDWLPGRLAALDADAAEGHVGEVDAEADGAGLGELVDEAAAEAGGLLVVEVEDVLPERVGDLDRGVEGVAEGDHLLPGGADHVSGVPGAVAGGEPDADAGEDLLALGYGAHLRCQDLDHVAHALRLGEVPLGPLGLGDQDVGPGEGGPVAAGGGIPGPPEVVVVQVGEGDRLDVRGAAAERGEAVQQLAASLDAERVQRRAHRDRADPGVDEQGAAVAFHQQRPDAGHQEPALVEVLGVLGPELIGGLRQHHPGVERGLAVRHIAQLRVAQRQGPDARGPPEPLVQVRCRVRHGSDLHVSVAWTLPAAVAGSWLTLTYKCRFIN